MQNLLTSNNHYHFPMPLLCSIFTYAFKHEAFETLTSFNFLRNHRVLKPNGLNFFGLEIIVIDYMVKGLKTRGTHNVNGFEVRFFTDDEIRSFCTEENFYTLWLKEEMKNQ